MKTKPALPSFFLLHLLEKERRSVLRPHHFTSSSCYRIWTVIPEFAFPIRSTDSSLVCPCDLLVYYVQKKIRRQKYLSLPSLLFRPIFSVSSRSEPRSTRYEASIVICTHFSFLLNFLPFFCSFC